VTASELTVRAAARDDVEQLSRVLARAFRKDPFHRWLFPEERQWELYSHRSFAVVIRDELRHETVLTTDQLSGAAIWRDPEREPPNLWARIRMAAQMIPIFGRRSRLIGRGFDQLLALHPAEPHWYLGVLGTDPQHQGKGVGSALMRPILDRCDAVGQLAYLEASRVENVPYYERHGFEVVAEFEMPQGPPVWRMQRQPRP
jgi:ribosomal protein S18 acetylase RimI-like enzyme